MGRNVQMGLMQTCLQVLQANISGILQKLIASYHILLTIAAAPHYFIVFSNNTCIIHIQGFSKFSCQFSSQTPAPSSVTAV